MKPTALFAACALALASAAPALAHEEVFSTTLRGTTEIPPNASAGIGTALVTVDLDLFTMEVAVSFAGLTGNTIASHIHCCTATPGSANVGVATMLPTFAGFPLDVTSGTYDQTFDMSQAASWNPAFITAQGSISNAFSALVAGMETGNAYLNIHTTEFRGGEIRGLLQAVPEPQTYALMLVGLGAVGAAARRRRV